MVKYDCKLRKMTIYTASFCIVTTTVLIVLGNQLKSMEMNPTSWLTTEKKIKEIFQMDYTTVNNQMSANQNSIIFLSLN